MSRVAAACKRVGLVEAAELPGKHRSGENGPNCKDALVSVTRRLRSKAWSESFPQKRGSRLKATKDTKRVLHVREESMGQVIDRL